MPPASGLAGRTSRAAHKLLRTETAPWWGGTAAWVVPPWRPVPLRTGPAPRRVGCPTPLRAPVRRIASGRTPARRARSHLLRDLGNLYIESDAQPSKIA